MKIFILPFALAITYVCNVYAQKVVTFENAAMQGRSYQHLDSLYKSAVHANTNLAVFKTPQQQQSLQVAYAAFMQDLGSFLRANNFKWDKQVRCFNRIYFAKNGTVDHFLYNFPPGEISAEKEKEFAGLLELYVKDHKFTLTANERFAQCSPIKYGDS